MRTSRSARRVKTELKKGGPIVTFFKTILYYPLYNLLIFLIYITPGHNVTLAIILLTILIRLIFVPSTTKMTRSQRKIQALKPELDKIQAQYKDSPQELGAKTWAFYKKNGVSPTGSCLPMLIQLPILFILYYVFRVGLDTSHFGLLYSFVPHPASINTNLFGINLSIIDMKHWIYWILPALAAAAQFWQMKQMMPRPNPHEKADPTQALSRQMAFIFPLMTFVIAWAGNIPSALFLYWIATSVFLIIQQEIVLREPLEILVEDATTAIEAADLPKAAKPAKMGETVKSKTSRDVTVRIRKKDD